MSRTAGSQTLDRGIAALEALAAAERPLSIAELAEALDVHRSNAYRLLRTLEERRLVLRDEAGLIKLGPRLVALARGAVSHLHSVSLAHLSEIANEVSMTAFLTVLDLDEVITVASVEPAQGHAAVAQRPGARHPIDQGAPGHAIESSLTESEHRELFDDAPLNDAATAALEHGYAISQDEVIKGLTSVAVPLRITGEPPAALAVVNIGMPEDLPRVVRKLQSAALKIQREIS